MTVPAASRTHRRATATALVLAVSASLMLFGAGSAGAAPTPVTCTLLGGSLAEPVSVQPNEQVQLVLVVPLLGTRVNVGPAQSVGDQPGERLIQGTVTDVVGLVGQVCQAVVLVQSTVSSVVPLPPITVPTLPGVPSQTIEVPIPGAQVDVDLNGQGDESPDGGARAPGDPPPGDPPPGGTQTGPSEADDSAKWGFDQAQALSWVPYGPGYRFGIASASAFRYGRQVPGYSPQFGLLPDSSTAGPVAARPVVVGRLALPVLLAVVMLALVSGALVRTWALRRV
jgi:hypothetical protein